MKYGYGNIPKGELIQNYKILCDKIVITYLDGTYYEIPLTKENEDDLLNQMIKQAQDRSQSSALSKAKNERKGTNISPFFQILTFLIIEYGIVYGDDKMLKIIVATGLGCGFCFAKVNELSKFKIGEVGELTKYDIYLSMREELEEYIEDPNLFNGIKDKPAKLNINTLDDYSLKDIKTVQKNLKRVRRKKL